MEANQKKEIHDVYLMSLGTQKYRKSAAGTWCPSRKPIFTLLNLLSTEKKMVTC
uniref:Uncharacterized protein n=1 Tax=Romanomermis culicivorax TaxID=13658 RepID=A0A915K3C4_ROMCU